MKKLLATIATACAAFLATPNNAEAGVHISIGATSTYVSGHAACGCPIYTQRVFRGYDRYRHPIYNYYRQPFRCSCRRHVHQVAPRVVYPRRVEVHGHRGCEVPARSHAPRGNAYGHSNQRRDYYQARGRGYRDR